MASNTFGRWMGASLLALTIGIGGATSVAAATLVGLTADNKLVVIDTGKMSAGTPVAISGADKVLGIDQLTAFG